MKKFHGVVQDSAGNGLSQVSITIYLSGTSTKATIYSDEGITTITNPTTSDSYGRYSFYIADGDYKLTFSGSTVTTYSLDPITIVDEYSLSTLLSSHTSNITTAHNINEKANISGQDFTGDIEIEKDQPAFGLNDTGIDGKYWRWISEYSVLKLQRNVGTEAIPEWYDVLVINAFDSKGDHGGKMGVEMVVRCEVKGQFRTDIHRFKEPNVEGEPVI